MIALRSRRSIQPGLFALLNRLQKALDVAHRLDGLVAQLQEAMEVAHADGVGQAMCALQRLQRQFVVLTCSHTVSTIA